MSFRIVLLLVGLTAVSVQAEEVGRVPNIVFIMADDLGYGDLGCYGCEDIKTPSLDRIAAEGVKFTDFYANGAVCSPTRVGFLTGRYQQRVGMDNALFYQEMGRGLPIDRETIAGKLKASGYATGLSGKWHVGYDRERQPLQQGFDHFFGILGGNVHYFEHMDRIGVPDLWLGNEKVKREGYITDLITDDAIQFIRENAEEPFFLFLSHPAPHFPWQGPGDKDKVIKPKTRSWQTGDRKTYIAMVERMDFGIGRVLEVLDDMNLAENTLVVFTSDNGGDQHSRNSPMRGFKGSIWEGGTRVPCVARWPARIPKGIVTKQAAITMYWTATFRSLGKAKYEKGDEDGVDLTPFICEGKDVEERTLFWRRKKGPVRKSVVEGRAVRRGNWKLVEQANGESFLFDLSRDIEEKTNRIDSNSDLVRELSKELHRWERDVADQKERQR